MRYTRGDPSTTSGGDFPAGGPFEVLPPAGAAEEAAVVHDDLSAREDGARGAANAKALIRRVVDAHAEIAQKAPPEPPGKGVFDTYVLAYSYAFVGDGWPS